MSRLHREECGAPGCDFVAGPSYDLNRVQRLADQCRASHRLDFEALKAAGSSPQKESPAELQRRRLAHLASYRRFEGSTAPAYLASLPAQIAAERESERQAAARDAARRRAPEMMAVRRSVQAERAARLAELSAIAWSQAI